MKRFILYICFIVAIALPVFMISCSPQAPQNNIPADPEPQATDVQKLEELIKNQTTSIEQYKSELESLKDIILGLKQDIPTSSPEPTPEPSAQFTYEIDNNSAVITGFSGDEENMVIPSHIDGYKIIAIADNCNLPQKARVILISEGIEKIGWFAFSNCTSLIKITIPDSVTSIGHSAFGSFSDQITIYCPDGSFAESYAKSYGIKHELY
jgi:hypothetical protein